METKINFNVNFGTFVNWYFNVNNAAEITGEMLRVTGYDEDDLGAGYIGVTGINTADDFAAFIVANYNAVVNIAFVPDKFGTFSRITLNNGVSFDMETTDEDEFLHEHAHGHVLTATYKGTNIYRADVFGRAVYCAVLWNEYPDTFTYWQTWRGMTKQIDFVKTPKGYSLRDEYNK